MLAGQEAQIAADAEETGKEGLQMGRHGQQELGFGLGLQGGRRRPCRSQAFCEARIGPRQLCQKGLVDPGKACRMVQIGKAKSLRELEFGH